jgi:hypothetical protein
VQDVHDQVRLDDEEGWEHRDSQDDVVVRFLR